MADIREETCLHYMGFGICAKGLDASRRGCCEKCSHYEASGTKGIRVFQIPGCKNHYSGQKARG